ncbi:hypothetical protein AB0K08_11320 [Citricoccus sp. NPDC055426]|uniref:hypothetical protein n=1 Tax=Citricoccus sp. NPDC055426 TaxID=3155536 RepID=UPI003423A9E9
MSSSSIKVPSGWMPASLAGADLVALPLNVEGRGNPTFMVSQRVPGTSPVAAPDPRAGSVLEGLAVGRDRWRGGAWTGLRFLRLSRSRSGRAVAEIRWLLWPAGDPAPDPEHSDPVLEATATCDLTDLLLLEPVLDGLATDLPRDFTPRLPAGTPTRQESFGLQYEPLGGEGASAGTGGPSDAASVPAGGLPDRWQGTGLVPVASSVVDTLRGTDPNRAWGRLDRETARPVVDAGLADPEGGRLSERAAQAATILQDPEQTSSLTITDAFGSRTVLTLARQGGLVVVLVPAGGDTAESRAAGDGVVLLGLYPVERSAEMVVRAAGLEPSGSRQLTPDSVSWESLVRRALDPSLPLPAGLRAHGGSPADGADAWQDLWAGHWTLWTLRTDGHPPLVALSGGPTGNHVVLRPEGEGGDGVRLVPTPTSSLFTALMARCSGPMRPAAAARGPA